MNAEPMDAMEMRATAQQYTGPSAGRIANLIPHAVGFERGWFRTTTAVCHGGESDGLAFRQRPDGNGIDVRCHTGGCTRGHIVTALEGLARSARARPLQRTRLARHRGSARGGSRRPRWRVRSRYPHDRTAPVPARHVVQGTRLH